MKKLFIGYITVLVILTCTGCISDIGKPRISRNRQLMNTVISAIEENDTKALSKVLSKDLQDKCTDFGLKKVLGAVPGKITDIEQFTVDDASERIKDSNNPSKESVMRRYYISCKITNSLGNSYILKLEFIKYNEFEPQKEGVSFVGVTPIDENYHQMKDTISIGTNTALSIW